MCVCVGGGGGLLVMDISYYTLHFLILDKQFGLFHNNTTGKIMLYLVKNLDSVIVLITHNYPSITKICRRHWKLKLDLLSHYLHFQTL